MSASPTYRFELASGSHTGRIRHRNEDCVVIKPEHGLAVLSDGMGGHRAGDIASSMAVDVITRELERSSSSQKHISKQQLINSVSAANTAIREKSTSKHECQGMGATILAAVFSTHKVIAAHLGDSRLYLFQDGELIQMTEDHTLAQQYLSEGLISASEAKTWAGRNMLLQALGIQDNIDPVITEIEFTANQIYVLCSDGLTDAVTDDQICSIIKAGLDANRPLQSSIERLIKRANKNGGPDNITVVLARISR